MPDHKDYPGAARFVPGSRASRAAESAEDRRARYQDHPGTPQVVAASGSARVMPGCAADSGPAW